MAVQKIPSRVVELDLEATAELPAIDFDSPPELQPPPETALATDIFPAPVISADATALADSLRDVEQQLQRKAERIDNLATDLAAAQLQNDELRAQLEQAGHDSAARESALQMELAAAVQRAADLQRHQQDDLQELRRRSTQLHEALNTWQGFRAFSESLLAASEAQLHGVDAQHVAALQEALAQIAALELSRRDAEQAQVASAAELRAATQRGSELEAALAASQAALAQLQQQNAELEDRARAGARHLDEQQQLIASLEAQLEAANAQQRNTEAQLRSATDRVQRLESAAHASAAVLSNLQQNMQRLGRDEAGIRPPQAATVQAVLRVLIRQENGSEVVYPLSRRTTIGRTPDNDIQVDAAFISRHHAVLLSSPDQCIVENLNSTNGVLVNGRRVERQILHDGDMVTVGKTEFRYQQRS